MNQIINYSEVTSADCSQVSSARFSETAGDAIAVDTGFTISIGTQPLFEYYFIPEVIYPSIPPQDIDSDFFSESDISRLMRLDSKSNPLLANMWCDDVNDDLFST